MYLQFIKYNLKLPLFILLFTSSLVFSQSTQDTLALINSYYQKGTSALKEQRYEESITNLIKANQLAESKSFEKEKLDIRFSLAQLNYYLQNFDKAATDLKALLPNLQATNDQEYVARALTLLGLVYAHQEDIQNASINFSKADEWYTSQNNEEKRANVLLGYGILEMKKKNYSAAINYFDASLSSFQKANMTYQEAYATLLKAESLLYVNTSDIQNNLSLAQQNLATAKNIATNNRFTKLEIESYRVASYLKLRQNDYSLAEENLRIYDTRIDSLQQVFLRAISAGINSESEVLGLNEIIDQQETELDKQRKSINLGKMTTGLSIALIVILSLLTLSL